MSNENDVYNRLLVRSDVWSRQKTSPDERGKYGYNAQKYPLTRQIIDDSILGNNITIGAYTVKPIDNTVINPTIDIDNHDGNIDIIHDVKIVYNALKNAGMFPYIEASAGDIKDGAHIGVICKPTLAAMAKKELKTILETTGLKHEVNPKQETVNNDGFGNLVKLPFQYNNRTKARSQIYNPETMEPFNRDDAIKYMLSLPDTVFSVKEPIEIPIQAIKEPITATTEPIKSDMGLCDFMDTHHIKPCIVKAYKESWGLHGTGDEGHNFRIAIAGDMIYNGANDEEVHKYFSTQKDYKREYTNPQIDSIKKYLATGKKPMGCKTIKEKCSTLLKGMCTGCINEPKEKISKDPKAKKIISDIDDSMNSGFGVYHGNMELAEEFQKITPVVYDISKNLWCYIRHKNYYERIDEIDILSAIRKKTEENVIDGTKAGEIKRAIEITGRERFRELKELKETWINTLSGIIDYKTGEIIKASPEYFLKCPVPHKIGKSTDTPIIDKLFSDWIGERKQILYEILSYCLIDNYPIHRMFILFGSGRNGKSQFLELLTRFIGRDNTTSTELEKIIDSRFECSKLYRKKAALIGETNFTAIKSSDRIKKITGHDMLTAEFKNKDPFDFTNTAKICIATNSVPETLDKTEAFHSRCIIIEFTNRFNEGKPIIDTIPESEYENLLAKCLGILPKLLEDGHFTNEGTIEEKAEKYERLSNVWDGYFNKFLDISDVNAYTPLWILYEDYITYCSKNGLRKESKTEISRKLRSAGYDVERKTIEGKTIFVVQGVKITQITQITHFPTSTLHRELSGTTVISVIPVISRVQVYKENEKIINSVTETNCVNPENIKNKTSKVYKEMEDLKTSSLWKKGEINNSNLTDFVMCFCKQSEKYKPSEVKEACIKLFKITPKNPNYPSLLCKSDKHEDCGGFECGCDCHTKQE